MRLAPRRNSVAPTPAPAHPAYPGEATLRSFTPVAAAADKTKKNAEKDKAQATQSDPDHRTGGRAAAAGGGVWFFTQSKHEDKTAQAPKRAPPRPRAVLRWTRRSWSISMARSMVRATCSWSTADDP